MFANNVICGSAAFDSRCPVLQKHPNKHVFPVHIFFLDVTQVIFELMTLRPQPPEC